MAKSLGHRSPLGAFHTLGGQIQRRSLGLSPLSILDLKTFYPHGFPTVPPNTSAIDASENGSGSTENIVARQVDSSAAVSSDIVSPGRSSASGPSNPAIPFRNQLQHYFSNPLQGDVVSGNESPSQTTVNRSTASEGVSFTPDATAAPKTNKLLETSQVNTSKLPADNTLQRSSFSEIQPPVEEPPTAAAAQSLAAQTEATTPPHSGLLQRSDAIQPPVVEAVNSAQGVTEKSQPVSINQPDSDTVQHATSNEIQPTVENSSPRVSIDKPAQAEPLPQPDNQTAQRAPLPAADNVQPPITDVANSVQSLTVQAEAATPPHSAIVQRSEAIQPTVVEAGNSTQRATKKSQPESTNQPNSKTIQRTASNEIQASTAKSSPPPPGDKAAQSLAKSTQSEFLTRPDSNSVASSQPSPDKSQPDALLPQPSVVNSIQPSVADIAQSIHNLQPPSPTALSPQANATSNPSSTSAASSDTVTHDAPPPGLDSTDIDQSIQQSLYNPTSLQRATDLSSGSNPPRQQFPQASTQPNTTSPATPVSSADSFSNDSAIEGSGVVLPSIQRLQESGVETSLSTTAHSQGLANESSLQEHLQSQTISTPGLSPIEQTQSEAVAIQRTSDEIKSDTTSENPISPVDNQVNNHGDIKSVAPQSSAVSNVQRQPLGESINFEREPSVQPSSSTNVPGNLPAGSNRSQNPLTESLSLPEIGVTGSVQRSLADANLSEPRAADSQGSIAPLSSSTESPAVPPSIDVSGPSQRSEIVDSSGSLQRSVDISPAAEISQNTPGTSERAQESEPPASINSNTATTKASTSIQRRDNSGQSNLALTAEPNSPENVDSFSHTEVNNNSNQVAVNGASRLDGQQTTEQISRSIEPPTEQATDQISRSTDVSTSQHRSNANTLPNSSATNSARSGAVTTPDNGTASDAASSLVESSTQQADVQRSLQANDSQLPGTPSKAAMQPSGKAEQERFTAEDSAIATPQQSAFPTNIQRIAQTGDTDRIASDELPTEPAAEFSSSDNQGGHGVDDSAAKSVQRTAAHHQNSPHLVETSLEQSVAEAGGPLVDNLLQSPPAITPESTLQRSSEDVPTPDSANGELVTSVQSPQLASEQITVQQAPDLNDIASADLSNPPATSQASTVDHEENEAAASSPLPSIQRLPDSAGDKPLGSDIDLTSPKHSETPDWADISAAQVSSPSAHTIQPSTDESVSSHDYQPDVVFPEANQGKEISPHGLSQSANSLPTPSVASDQEINHVQVETYSLPRRKNSSSGGGQGLIAQRQSIAPASDSSISQGSSPVADEPEATPSAINPTQAAASPIQRSPEILDNTALGAKTVESHGQPDASNRPRSRHIETPGEYTSSSPFSPANNHPVVQRASEESLSGDTQRSATPADNDNTVAQRRAESPLNADSIQPSEGASTGGAQIQRVSDRNPATPSSVDPKQESLSQPSQSQPPPLASQTLSIHNPQVNGTSPSESELIQRNAVTPTHNDAPVDNNSTKGSQNERSKLAHQNVNSLEQPSQTPLSADATTVQRLPEHTSADTAPSSAPQSSDALPQQQNSTPKKPTRLEQAAYPAPADPQIQRAAEVSETNNPTSKTHTSHGNQSVDRASLDFPTVNLPSAENNSQNHLVQPQADVVEPQTSPPIDSPIQRVPDHISQSPKPHPTASHPEVSQPRFPPIQFDAGVQNGHSSIQRSAELASQTVDSHQQLSEFSHTEPAKDNHISIQSSTEPIEKLTDSLPTQANHTVSQRSPNSKDDKDQSTDTIETSQASLQRSTEQKSPSDLPNSVLGATNHQLPRILKPLGVLKPLPSLQTATPESSAGLPANSQSPSTPQTIQRQGSAQEQPHLTPEKSKSLVDSATVPIQKPLEAPPQIAKTENIATYIQQKPSESAPSTNDIPNEWSNLENLASQSSSQPTAVQRSIQTPSSTPQSQEAHTNDSTATNIPGEWSNLADLVNHLEDNSTKPKTVQRSTQTSSMKNPQSSHSSSSPQRPNAQTPASSPTVKLAKPATVTIQRAAPASTTNTLIQACKDPSADSNNTDQQPDNPPDYSEYLELLAQEVYGLLRQRLSLEQERRGPRYPR